MGRTETAQLTSILSKEHDVSAPPTSLEVRERMLRGEKDFRSNPDSLYNTVRNKFRFGRELVNPAGQAATVQATEVQVPTGGLVIGQGGYFEEQPLTGGRSVQPKEFNNIQERRSELKWEFRPIQEADIDAMIKNGWFKDSPRVAHLKGDLINKDTLPTNWEDLHQVQQFRKRLMEFYFPGGPFQIDAKDNEGNLINSAIVERKTIVVEKDGVLAGTTSWLTGEETGDPWSHGSDPKGAHTQMHFVAEEFSGQGLGLALAIARTNTIFDEVDKNGNPKYDQIVTWVNTVGAYHVNERLFESMGYEELGNKIYINTTDPEKAVKMRRYVLNRDVWLQGRVHPDGLVVGRDACIDRWELKKKGLNHRQPNLG